MATVRFYPENKTVQVEEGTTILEASQRAGVLIESPCNAEGLCGKCRVKLEADSIAHVTQSETGMLSPGEVAQGWVLSCHTRITGDITVEIAGEHRHGDLKILDHGQIFQFAIECYIKKRFQAEINATGIIAGKDLLAYEAGNTENLNYGMVVDIGTTTLVASLIDLNTGRELTTSSALNPQAVYAQDVLSRIKFASDPQGLETMAKVLIKKLNNMIRVIAKRAGVERSNIYEIIFSGNTCMLHLAVRVNPYLLGKYPYHTQIPGNIYFKASQHGLEISDSAIIYLPPVISAYIGADITSGILASQLYRQERLTLFIDIGTNGEIVIGKSGSLSATSTAAGPAFEGMNIACGMRAGRGAVEYFRVGGDGTLAVKTVGNVKPTGICGSGLIDIVGELVKYGVLNKNGRFVNPDNGDLRPELRERLKEHNGKTVFEVAESVYLYQKDIRQVQLAKGAIRAGIELLMDNQEIKAADIDKVLIAGSFGYHLRTESLINIGLLPAEFEGKIEFIGNTSKSGGYAFLLNQSYRQEMSRLVKDIEVIELANYQNFDRVFISCLNF